MDHSVHCSYTELFALLQDTLLYSLQPSGLCQYSYPEGPKDPPGAVPSRT